MDTHVKQRIRQISDEARRGNGHQPHLCSWCDSDNRALGHLDRLSIPNFSSENAHRPLPCLEPGQTSTKSKAGRQRRRVSVSNHHLSHQFTNPPTHQPGQVRTFSHARHFRVCWNLQQPGGWCHPRRRPVVRRGLRTGQPDRLLDWSRPGFEALTARLNGVPAAILRVRPPDAHAPTSATRAWAFRPRASTQGS